MSRPGSDGSAERLFHIRSADELWETLQQIAGDSKTVITMQTVEISRHIDAVYWAQIHWSDGFQWSATYHKSHVDISSMGFLRRFQYRCLAQYTETPETIEEQARSIAENAKKKYAKERRNS